MATQGFPQHLAQIFARPPFSRCLSSWVCSLRLRRRFGAVPDTSSVRLLVAEEAEGLLCGFAAFCFVFLGGSLTSDMGTSSNLKCLSSPIRASSFCTILNSSSVKRSCPGPQPRKQALGRARVEAFARLFGMTSAFLFGMALGCRCKGKNSKSCATPPNASASQFSIAAYSCLFLWNDVLPKADDLETLELRTGPRLKICLHHESKVIWQQCLVGGRKTIETQSIKLYKTSAVSQGCTQKPTKPLPTRSINN